MLLSLLLPAAVAAANIGSGYSALWYDPARSGEGLQLEILDSNYALVEWYTYDEHGAQRWITGVGLIAHSALGDSIDFTQLFITQGGKFGSAFDPNAVTRKAVGDATLSFSGCNAGTFHYDAFGQSQTLPMQRLTYTMGAGCQPINGVPGEPVMTYAGQSGSWYNASRSGEGFDLEWMSDNRAIVTWYTYDLQGNPLWLLGVGTEQPDGSIRFEHMDRPHGAHFGTAFDPASVQHEDWGALTLQIDCSSGTVHYASSDSAFGSGDINETRLTQLLEPACPTVQPKLSDLYNITWDEIPIAAGTPPDPNFLKAQAIADDGTLAGNRNGHMVLWHPSTQTWQDISRDISTQPVDISPDGSAVVATDDIPADQTQPIDTLLWQRSTGWQVLPGDVVTQSVHWSVSHNFEYVAGSGHNTDQADSVWIHPIDGVQELLPKTADVPAGYPYAVTDDGTSAVGITLRFPSPTNPQPIAARWYVDSPPTILQDPAGEDLALASACDSNCNIIFGGGLYDYDTNGNFVFDPNHPHPGEAWYLINNSVFGYFGALPDAPVTSLSYVVSDATPDGSMAVGTYKAYSYVNDPAAGTSNRAYIWTEATGIVSVRSLTDELGIGDDDWYEIDSVRVSPDGRQILIGGVRDPNYLEYRAVVLQLTPKQSNN